MSANLYKPPSGIYQWQRRVPTRLVIFFGAKLWKASLRTRDLREAMRLGAVRDAESDRWIAEGTRATEEGWASWDDFKNAAKRVDAVPAYLKVPEGVFVAGIVEHFRLRLDRLASDLDTNPVHSTADAVSRIGDLHRPLPGSLRSETATFQLDLDGVGLDAYAPPPVFSRDRMREALAATGLHLDPTDQLFHRHWRGFAQASQAFVAIAERALSSNDPQLTRLRQFVGMVGGMFEEGERSASARASRMSSTAIPAIAQHASPTVVGKTLSDMREIYISERAREKSWAPRTAVNVRAAITLFEATAGDKPMGAYTKAEAREFQSVLFGLPPNWSKHKRLAGLGPREAAALAQESGMDGAAVATVRNVFGHVGALFAWAHAKYDDEVPDDVFKNLRIDKPSADERDQRNPFTVAELQTMFASDLFTANADRRSGKFWIPIVGLFTGMRLAEIVQLHRDDIRTDEGITYFDIVAGEDKRIKSASAKRRIPVHAELVAIGFLKFVTLKKTHSGKRIFADIPKGDDGSWSKRFSAHFGRRLRDIGIKHDKLSFHSLRHSFEDACRNSGLSGDMMDVLQGHKLPGERARYGSGFDLPSLKAAMDRVSYRGLDLTHLHRAPD